MKVEKYVLIMTVFSSKGQQTKALIHVLKYSSGGALEPAKLYKLQHLSKVEVASNDDCTFTLGFDNLRSHSVSPPQWTMRNTNDRNRFLVCILTMCKDMFGHLPKVTGIDVVEMAIWAKAHTPSVASQAKAQIGSTPVMEPNDLKVTVERELVSQTEEEDMEALLGTYVMGIGEAEAFSERLKRELLALEAANVHAILESQPLIEEVLQGLESAMVCVDDMDEWLGIFNVKLRHMREDIASIESRNNKLEMQSLNNKTLIEELDKVLGRLRVPSEFAASLTGGSFDEARMLQNVEACEWLTGALHALEVPNLDPCYANMRAAREFASELRASTKASRNPTLWLEASAGSSQVAANADTSSVSEAYAKMLTIFVPLLVDESSFFAHFMCFEVLALVPQGVPAASVNKGDSLSDDLNDEDLSPMDADGNDLKPGKDAAELKALNEALKDLLDGIQEDFYAVVDWAYKIDPLRCISMHGITEKYLSGQKADAAGFVRRLLDDLESKISSQFNKFVDEACYQIERNEKSIRPYGVFPYIPRFATLATRMEQYIQGQSRDLVDQAYTKFISVMFTTLDRIAQTEPKYADVVLLENYAAFQNSLYDLANVVPTLAKFYHQASESYEQACTRHITSIIYSVFDKLFQFGRKIEDLMYTISPEEIPYQTGLFKADLRKVLRATVPVMDKLIVTMLKRLQKNLTSEELLPSLWDKCKKEFLEKYESFAVLISKIYPTEDNMPSVAEMKETLASI
ncbi:unnamed protein product [Victoria cruziana]